MRVVSPLGWTISNDVVVWLLRLRVAGHVSVADLGGVKWAATDLGGKRVAVGGL